MTRLAEALAKREVDGRAATVLQSRIPPKLKAKGDKSRKLHTRRFPELEFFV